MVGRPGELAALDARVFADAVGDTARSLVCILDFDGRILLFNDACERATGYASDEVVGRDARETVIPREEAEAFGEVLAGIERTGLSSPQVGNWRTKDGKRRLIAWSNKPVRDGDGQLQCLVTTGVLIEERAREDALEGDLEAKLAEVGRLAQEQRALRRVATLVASEETPERVFTAVSEECARVIDTTGSAVFRYEGDDTATVVGRYDDDGNPGAFLLGQRIVLDDNSTVGRVLYSGAPERIDDYEELVGGVAETMRTIGYRSTVSAPIPVAGVLWGAVAVASQEILPPDTEARLAAFAELVSLAVASAQARDDLRASRARLVRAGDEQRRKLERNLHDGAQQRLVALAITLRLARSKLADDDPAAAEQLLANGAQELDGALQELRELARGLHPMILTDQGLAPALRALVPRVPIEVDLEVPEERFDPAVEAAAYYIVSESLTNIAKHADATRASVCISQDEAMLRAEVSDDGRGGADPSGGTGILGLRDRAEAIGGSLVVVSPPGRGTTVTAALPLVPR